jgi:hypothetical protein
MKRIVSAVAVLCMVVFGAQMSHAQNVDSIVLTIDGKIDGGAARDFSMGELEALGTAVIETTTPWHDAKIRFEGVPLQRLMEHVGASGETAAVLALNNYRTEVPLSDFKTYSVILAIKKDGAYMPVSDKGPFFIIYPFDSFAELKSELYYARSAWQVRSITIE